MKRLTAAVETEQSTHLCGLETWLHFLPLCWTSTVNGPKQGRLHWMTVWEHKQSMPWPLLASATTKTVILPIQDLLITKPGSSKNVLQSGAYLPEDPLLDLCLSTCKNTLATVWEQCQTPTPRGPFLEMGHPNLSETTKWPWITKRKRQFFNSAPKMWEVKDQNLIPFKHLVVNQTRLFSWNLAAYAFSDRACEDTCGMNVTMNITDL